MTDKDCISSDRARDLFVVWLDGGRPELHTDLSAFIRARMVKVFAMYTEIPIDRARNMVVAGVACGLDTDHVTSRTLCDLVGFSS